MSVANKDQMIRLTNVILRSKANCYQFIQLMDDRINSLERRRNVSFISYC